MATREQVLEALRSVQDPELFKDIVTLNMVKSAEVSGTTATIDVELTTPACPLKDRIRADVTAAVKKIPGIAHVEIKLSSRVRSAGDQRTILPGVKNIIAVGAGKGGVGKSTIAVAIAAGLAMRGATVGLMDADVYGPSIPTMTGLEAQSPAVQGDKIIPFTVGPEGQTIKVMSIGFIVPKEKALIWRGPMVHGVIRQFLEQVQWGELDYLVVDLPPGTGDVALTLAQSIPLTGAVIVATPQEVALMDARRAVRMFQQLGVSILGVVENMSYFVCGHGTQYDLFGRGGAQRMATDMGLPFLGELPMDIRIPRQGDQGDLFAGFKTDSPSLTFLNTIVETLAGQISVRNITRPAAKSIKLEVTD
jgi:ATP-binding protein involved in chromosome partitioning